MPSILTQFDPYDLLLYASLLGVALLVNQYTGGRLVDEVAKFFKMQRQSIRKLIHGCYYNIGGGTVPVSHYEKLIT